MQSAVLKGLVLINKYVSVLFTVIFLLPGCATPSQVASTSLHDQADNAVDQPHSLFYLGSILTETDLSANSGGSTTQTTIFVGVDANELAAYDPVYTWIQINEVLDDKGRTIMLDNAYQRRRWSQTGIARSILSKQAVATGGEFKANKVPGASPPSSLIIKGELRIAIPESRKTVDIMFDTVGNGMNISPNFHVAHSYEESHNTRYLRFDFDPISYELPGIPLTIATIAKSGSERELYRPGATLQNMNKTVLRWEYRFSIDLPKNAINKEQPAGVRVILATQLRWIRMPFEIRYSENEASNHRPIRVIYEKLDGLTSPTEN
ncbi:hypothetical protein JYT11_00545 [Planctomycetaceae bacterium AH-315-I19]|nr:hypothetical protein [Planctomycetaceae bacterium AH-315-I19]